MSSKTLVLFNHKGGVSKTTTTFNLGWTLTQKSKRVLLVDGDPQCNLTGLMMGDSFDDYYTDAKTKEQNIKDGVKVAFEGKPHPIKPIDCFISPVNESLLMIPGHMDLSEYDSALSLALMGNNAITTLQNLPGAFYELINKCTDEYQIDYVLIDMNPGLSAINQTFFIMSDGFIVPTNPDPFSVMALKTLSTILPRWKDWAERSRDIFSGSSYPLPHVEMKFIGEIIQRFNLRNKKAAKPYTGRIEEIKQYVETEFVTKLKQHNMVFDMSSLGTTCSLNDHCLAEISEFGALLQNANDHSIPVVALTEDKINATGTVLEQMVLSKNRFVSEFNKIADVVLELVA